jgi:hypothetical protein
VRGPTGKKEIQGDGLETLSARRINIWLVVLLCSGMTWHLRFQNIEKVKVGSLYSKFFI